MTEDEFEKSIKTALAEGRYIDARGLASMAQRSFFSNRYFRKITSSLKHYVDGSHTQKKESNGQTTVL